MSPKRRRLTVTRNPRWGPCSRSWRSGKSLEYSTTHHQTIARVVVRSCKQNNPNGPTRSLHNMVELNPGISGCQSTQKLQLAKHPPTRVREG